LLQKADIETKNEELYTQNQHISEQNEAIGKQRDELALANATKDKFFSIIAHDLRGPVGNLTAFFDLILESYQEQLDPKLQELFNLIKTSVQQTYTLLENLLTWAQLQNGTIPFNPVSNSIFSLVDNNINLLQTRANEKSITILNQVPGDLQGKFDTHLIDSVIRNLISNAIKFTFSNGVIKITGRKMYNSIEISIEDTGIGMSEAETSKLFKIDVKHKSKEGTEGEKGTGLGLILCKEFIELHKGKIWVESEPGKGSQFKFVLPAN
jgi:signal transduction histidine kinase